MLVRNGPSRLGFALLLMAGASACAGQPSSAGAASVAAGPSVVPRAEPSARATSEAGSPASGEPVHADPAGLERATVETMEALLRDDPRAARRALDRIEQNCRRLMPEEAEVFGGDIVSADQGMHKPLTRAREEATRGDLDESLNMFVWVMRSCRYCHGLARQRGLLSPAGPGVGPGDRPRP